MIKRISEGVPLGLESRATRRARVGAGAALRGDLPGAAYWPATVWKAGGWAVHPLRPGDGDTGGKRRPARHDRTGHLRDGRPHHHRHPSYPCLLYTSDAADDLLCVDLGGRRIIKKKKKKKKII